MADTIELFMCGGDAAFLSNYFDQLFRLLWSAFPHFPARIACRRGVHRV